MERSLAANRPKTLQELVEPAMHPQTCLCSASLGVKVQSSGYVGSCVLLVSGKTNAVQDAACLTSIKEAAAARAAALLASMKLLGLLCAEQRISPVVGRAAFCADLGCTAGLATDVCKHVAIMWT